MSKFQGFHILSAVLLFQVAALGEDAVYKSVDQSGNVTYSAEPPGDSATVEAIQPLSGPSEEATKDALDRAGNMEQEADAVYDSMMERRRQEAEARKRTQEEAKTAEQDRRADESPEETESAAPGYIWYPRDWHGPHPPRPPRPPHPPHPPQPPIRGIH